MTTVIGLIVGALIVVMWSLCSAVSELSWRVYLLEHKESEKIPKRLQRL